MRTYQNSRGRVVLDATPDERLWLINRIAETHQYFQELGAGKVRPVVRNALETAWLDIPLNARTFTKLTGRPRHILHHHGLRARAPHRHGVGRMNGNLDPADLVDMQVFMTAAVGRRMVSRAVLDRLFRPDSKSDRLLVIRLLGLSEIGLENKYLKKEGEAVDAYSLLARPTRSHDKGRAGQGQGTGAGEHTNQGDRRPDRSEAIPEPRDAGPLRGPEGPAHTDPRPDQDQGQLPHHPDTSIDSVPEAEREFLAIADIPPAPEIVGVDEDGDSYLADLDLPEGSGVLAGFVPWEQDFDD